MLIRGIGNFLILLAMATTTNAYSDTQNSSANIQIESLVTVEWLREHLDDPDLVVLDTSVQIDFDEHGGMVINSGRDAYEQGHIPTAGFADLTNELVDASSPYPYALPTPEKFAAAMGALGVGDDTRVVLYASDFSAWAARVWWMLRWIGHDNAAVLDGGLQAWTDAGFPVSMDAAENGDKILSIDVRPKLVAERDEVFAAISDDSVVLIDAMPAEFFRGEVAMYGRPGHIPTAINVPTVFAEDGRFLTDDVLNEMHTTHRDTRAITYCGGGISASANAFAMHRLGFTDIAVYMNSLDEWAADPTNPMILGE